VYLQAVRNAHTIILCIRTQHSYWIPFIVGRFPRLVEENGRWRVLDDREGVCALANEKRSLEIRSQRLGLGEVATTLDKILSNTLTKYHVVPITDSVRRWLYSHIQTPPTFEVGGCGAGKPATNDRPIQAPSGISSIRRKQNISDYVPCRPLRGRRSSRQIRILTFDSVTLWRSGVSIINVCGRFAVRSGAQNSAKQSPLGSA
jgi:hypothetical protein